MFLLPVASLPQLQVTTLVEPPPQTVTVAAKQCFVTTGQRLSWSSAALLHDSVHFCGRNDFNVDELVLVRVPEYFGPLELN